MNPPPTGHRTHRPGIYRRRLRIVTRPGEARADLEDDPHRYGVAIRHDGTQVLAIEGFPIRIPWTSCAAASANLQRLVGMPLTPDPTAIFRHTVAGEQCTHLFDTAGLAIAHAARGTARRQYDVEAPWWTPEGPRTITLAREGREVLRWTVERDAILGPEPFAGRNWRKMLDWARAEFPDADDLEAIVVLRRAIMISGSRTVTLDPMRVAADTGHVNGACYVYRPGVAEHAQRVRGSTLDFTDRPEALLADLEPAA